MQFPRPAVFHDKAKRTQQGNLLPLSRTSALVTWSGDVEIVQKRLEARSYLQGDKMGEVLAEVRMARGELQPGQPGLLLSHIIYHIYYIKRVARGKLQPS